MCNKKSIYTNSASFISATVCHLWMTSLRNHLSPITEFLVHVFWGKRGEKTMLLRLCCTWDPSHKLVKMHSRHFSKLPDYAEATRPWAYIRGKILVQSKTWKIWWKKIFAFLYLPAIKPIGHNPFLGKQGWFLIPGRFPRLRVEENLFVAIQVKVLSN